MRVLVTGGSGFIGSHLIRELLSNPRVTRVLSLDAVPQPCRPAETACRFDSIVGDIRSDQTCLEAAKDMDCIIHLAAVASVPASIDDPVSTFEVNVRGTQNLLEAARVHKVQHFIAASSSAVYGDSSATRKSEAHAPSPLSPYAASKLAMEGLCRSYSESYGIASTVFRFFNVFGPGQDASHPYAAVIPRFLSAIKHGRRPQIFGDGGQTRDFVSVFTVAHALSLVCLDRLETEHPVNLANGQATSVNQLLQVLSVIRGHPVDAVYAAERIGDIRHSLADVRALEEFLPERRVTSITEDVRRTYEWYMSDPTI